MSNINWKIRAATQSELEWFCRECVGYAPCVDIKGIVCAWENSHYIGAMVAYDHWVPASCEMHVWVGTRGALSRKFIREAINYPFASGRKVIIGRTPMWNYRARDFNKRIGFREVVTIAGAYGAAPPGHVLITPEHEYGISFQELRPSDVEKWFPGNIIQNSYEGVQWLSDARIEWEARKSTQQSQAKMTWDPEAFHGLLTKTPPLSLKPTSSPSSAFWKKRPLVPESMEAMKKVWEDVWPRHPPQVIHTTPDERSGLAAAISSNTIVSPLDTPKSES